MKCETKIRGPTAAIPDSMRKPIENLQSAQEGFRRWDTNIIVLARNKLLERDSHST